MGAFVVVKLKVPPKSLDKILHHLVQGALVALETENVLPSLVDDLLRDLFLTARGVDGHHDPFQGKRGQDFLHGLNFVGFALRFDLPWDEAPMNHPDADHMSRASAVGPIVRSPQGLAIQRNDLLRALLQGKGDSNPTGETLGKSVRIDQGEHPTEGIMGKNPIGQLEEFSKPIQAVFAEHGHFHPGVAASDHPAQSHDENVHQLVAILRRTRGSGNASK